MILWEWSVTLLRATPGRHSTRHRTRLPRGEVDTTWAFTIAVREDVATAPILDPPLCP